MDQATQATTPTASTQTSDITAQRAAHKHVNNIAQRIIDRLTAAMPTAVETRRSSIHLHFGMGLLAGRGVLEVARIAGVDPTREPRDTSEAWIECRALVEGIPLVARALLTRADADQLMQHIPSSPTADEAETPPTVDQPVPLGTSVLAHVPAVTPVEAIGGGQ